MEQGQNDLDDQDLISGKKVVLIQSDRSFYNGVVTGVV